MSKLVKTGFDLYKKYVTEGLSEEEKYLILPEGLDKLEEMLKEELDGYAYDRTRMVFARFKKENGL